MKVLAAIAAVLTLLFTAQVAFATDTTTCCPGNNGVGNDGEPQPFGDPPVNDGGGTSPSDPGNQGGGDKDSSPGPNSDPPPDFAHGCLDVPEPSGLLMFTMAGVVVLTRARRTARTA